MEVRKPGEIYMPSSSGNIILFWSCMITFIPAASVSSRMYSSCWTKNSKDKPEMEKDLFISAFVRFWWLLAGYVMKRVQSSEKLESEI